MAMGVMMRFAPGRLIMRATFVGLLLRCAGVQANMCSWYPTACRAANTTATM